ncbi:IS110 family transposase [Enterococcus rivorum]|uniref:IS110 family transposase n=1 Tax=Enterococcus rivorum TaxID=762845 RepID=UPI003635F444
MDRTKYLYVGMDIHKDTHTAVLMNYLEEKLGEITITNTLQGFRKLENYVVKQQGELIPIWIGRCDSLRTKFIYISFG